MKPTLNEIERFFVGAPVSTIEAKQPPVISDKLTQMYEMQRALDTRIINERRVDKTVDEWVVGLTIAMESEIDEIRREVNWKWWKNPKEIDVPALQGEVIDMFHFLLALAREVGLAPDDIHRLYMEKNAENHDRQDGTSTKKGYDIAESFDKAVAQNGPALARLAKEDE